MIHYYYKTKHHSATKSLEEIRVGSWVHVVNPSKREIHQITESLGLDDSLITDALDWHEVPRIDQQGDSTFFYVRLPTYTIVDIQFSTIPCCLILSNDHIITIAPADTPELWNMFIEDKVDYLTTQRTKFFIIIVNEIIRLYHKELTAVNKRIRKYITEDERVSDDDILEFVKYERTINDFLDALTPMNSAIENVFTGRHLQLFASDKALIEDLSLSTEQLINWSKGTLRTIQNIREAYSTILTNQLNVTMKRLTVVTIVLTVPTMIAGLFGMNVKLPISDISAGSFWLIIAFAVLVSVVLYVLIIYGRQRG